MARTVKKSGSRKRFAEGGTSDRYQAKYDRKVADIESDYQKAMARKTGRAAEVAKAKYEQRMADAKDDLAKWRGGDRTETRAAERAAERNLSTTRRVGARAPLNIEKDQPSLDKYIKPVDVDTKSLIKNATPTAPAPAPRVRRPRTSTAGNGSSFIRQYWRGNPSGYSQDQKKKVKGVSIEEAAAAQRKAGKSNVPPKSDTPTYRDPLLHPYPQRPSGEGFFSSILRSIRDSDTNRAYAERQRLKYGKKKGGKITAKATKAGKAMVKKSADTMGRAMVKKYAKGGSIDGCAIRGKTRAPMKKGK